MYSDPNEAAPDGFQLTFSGGSGRVSLAHTLTHRVNQVQARLRVDGPSGIRQASQVGVAFEGEIFLSPAGFGGTSAVEQGFEEEKEMTRDQEDGQTVETTHSFTLADADVSDYFVVEVYMYVILFARRSIHKVSWDEKRTTNHSDPLYGTYAFKTVAGASHCPHEANTVALEVPKITLLEAPSAPVLPGHAAYFTVRLENLGRGDTTLELYMNSTENLDGLGVAAGGELINVPLTLQNFRAGLRTEEVIVVERGPHKYKYSPLTIGLRSACDSNRALNTGNNPTHLWADSNVQLLVEFLEPCPEVVLHWPAPETATFVSELTSAPGGPHANGLLVQASNPAQPFRRWAQLTERLLVVRVEFRDVRAGSSSSWRPAQSVGGGDLELVDDSYGNAQGRWNVQSLPDGEYEVRVVSRCVPWSGSGHVGQGVNQFASDVARVVLDRRPPLPFGLIEPSDGVYFPGDELSATFDKALDCSKPYSFTLALVVEGMEDHVFTPASKLAVLCNDNVLRAVVDFRLVPYHTLMGRKATLRLEDVRDLAGNEAPMAYVHQFRFAQLDTDKATVKAHGIPLPLPNFFAPNTSLPVSSPAWQAAAQNVTAYLSAFLEVSTARIKVVSLRWDAERGVLLADVNVHALNSGTRLRALLGGEAGSASVLAALEASGAISDFEPGMEDVASLGGGQGQPSYVLQSGANTARVDGIEASVAVSFFSYSLPCLFLH